MSDARWSSSRRAALVVLVGGFVLSCSRSSYKVPGDSMYPTIPEGSSIKVDRGGGAPARGDIVVFDAPDAPKTQNVKRVIGVGGDRVEIKGRTVTVNGRELATCPIGRVTHASDAGVPSLDVVLESDGAHAYLVAHDARSYLAGGPAAGTGDGAWTVNAGEYFVLGDNRDASHDSRASASPYGRGVAGALVKGKVRAAPLALPADATSLASALVECTKKLGVR